MERNNNTKKVCFNRCKHNKGIENEAHFARGKGYGSRHHTNVEISIFFSIVRSRSTKINQAYLFRFKCKLNKYLLQLFIDKVDGKLLKLIVLKKENGACVNNS